MTTDTQGSATANPSPIRVLLADDHTLMPSAAAVSRLLDPSAM